MFIAHSISPLVVPLLPLTLFFILMSNFLTVLIIWRAQTLQEAKTTLMINGVLSNTAFLTCVLYLLFS